MSDGRRGCLGFVFLAAAVVLAVVFGIGGWVIGGDAGSGLTAGLAAFIVCAALAGAMFISIRDWAWIPTVLAGIYAILPDLLVGPTDDIVAMGAGMAITGLLSWRRNRREKHLPK